MNFSMKPDYDQVSLRNEAFWNGALHDRAMVSLRLPKLRPVKPVPHKTWPDLKARWLDLEFRVDEIDAQMSNTDFLADSLPVAWPNLGPEIFSAWHGCPYTFGESTAWTEPVIKDWETDVPKAVMNWKHPLFLAMEEFTRLLLERGRGRWITGMTDLHPGGDHVAALRNPENLAMDLYEFPDQVKAQVAATSATYRQVYDHFYNTLRAENQPISHWLETVHEGRTYIPSNDFSGMISTEMFEEFFLDDLKEEINFYERSIYHLDGPGALRHLDLLLAIPNLHAIQWVPGANHEEFAASASVYQRIQKAGKGLTVFCDVSELDQVFQSLKPDGVWLKYLTGVTDHEMAQAVLKRVVAWK